MSISWAPDAPLCQPIDLMVVATADMQAAFKALLADQQVFRVIALDSARGALAVLDDSLRPRSLLALSHAAPSAGSLQELLDVAHLLAAPVLWAQTPVDAQLVAKLLAAGVQDIVDLSDLNAARLHRVVVASITRECARRDLVRLRGRALLKRDIVAAVAAAGTRMEILRALADGLLALGASGVTCWERAESGFEVVLEVGAPTERWHTGPLARDASHPVVDCATQRGAAWYHDAQLLQSTYTDFVAAEQPSSLGFVPVQRGNECSGAFSIAHDRLPEEDETLAIEQLCQQVGEALRRAELETQLRQDREADRRLLGVVSHDLRGPLSNILLGARLLLRQADGKTAETLRRIERAAQTAARLTQDLLGFVSRSSELQLSLEPVDLYAVLAGCVEDAQGRTTKRRTLRLELEGAEAHAQADVGRMEQAVGNLIANALSYAAEGSEIVVRGATDDYAVYIEVENLGSAIDVDKVGSLFEPNVRLATVVDRGSIGLGLFIVARIMAAHAGRVWVEQTPPDTVKFSLQLPREGARGAPANVLKLEPAGRRSSTPPPPPRQEQSPFLGLHQSFRAPALSQVLDAWTAARRTGTAPHPLSLDRSLLLAVVPDMVTARVSLDADAEPSFVLEELGARLERRLRGTLRGTTISADAELASASQHEAYRRCWQQKAPTYDYLRERSAHPFSMERLILPFSRDGGRSITHILAVVIFTGDART